MPQLYFKIGSDWAEVVRLRQEIARLESQLHQFNGNAPLKVLDKLCDELSAAKTRMQALLDDAAIAGKKLEDAFKASVKIDLSTPEGQLKAFDTQLQKMCSSLDAYFENVKGKLRELQSLMGDGQAIAGNIKVNDGNVRRIEEMKRQNAELQEQIQRQTEEIERQQQQWQQLADAVRNNNVAAIQQLSQQTDEATRRLRMDAAKGSINGITEELNEMAEKMAIAEGKAEALKAILDDLRNRKQNGDATIADSSIADAEQSYQKANEELKKMKAEYNSMSAEQKKYVDQLKDASGHHVRMRTQIIDAREKMAQLIAAGQTGTPAFRQLAEQAAVMRRQITLANATMQYFSNPTRHLETLKVAMQGVAGAAGLVTGLFGIFNTESEKMAQIQTKVQSALAIVVGLETTYATVKKTSNVMMAVSEFQAWAATKAKLAEAAATNAGTLATIKATAAQRAFNLVASMNPYVLLATAIGALGVALFSFTKSAKTATEAEKELTKAQEEQRKVNEKLGSSVGDTIAEYMLMQKQWESLSTAHEKNSWIDENKTKFKQMGLTIGDINTAEKVFVDHSKEVIAALKARAEAEAWGEIYKERIKKKAENDMNGSIANGRYLENFHAGDRVNVGKLRQTYGKTVNTNTVGGSEGYFRVDGTHFGTSYSNNEFVRLTEESARDLNAKALEMANAITKAEDDAIKLAGQQMDEAQKRAAEAQLDLQRKIGNSGIGSGNDTSGKSPDEIVRMQMQQEQEAIRQRQQNLLLQEQAVIDQMQDGTEKELAQMRLSHKKRMAELDDEQEALLNKKREQASVDSKGNKRKGFYSSGAYSSVNLSGDELSGVNAKRVSENEAYADSVVAWFKKITSGSENTEDMMKRLRTVYSGFVSDINSITEQTASDGSELFKNILSHVEEQFDRSQAEIRRMELQSMRDYLKDYGSFEQQKLAVTQIYEERIKKAKTEGERLRLQKEQQQAISSLTVNNAMMGIDWSALLQGVGSLSQDMMKPMLERLETIMNSEEFNNADIREREKIVELVSQMRQYVGTDQSVTWQQLATAISKFQSAVDSFNKAESDEKAALQRLADARQKREKGEITQSDFEKIEREANELGQKTVEARDEMQRLGKTLNETSDQVANAVSPLTAALNNAKAWQGVDGFSQLKGASQNMDELQNTLNSILPSMGEGMAKTIGSGLSSAIGSMSSVLGSGLESVLSSGIGSMIGIIAQIPKMILQIAEIIKNVVTGILDAITTILKLEWVSDLVNSILEAVGNLIDAIFDLPENIAHLLESIVVDGVGGLVDGVIGRVGNVLSFGALSSKGISDWFTNGNEEEVAETSKALTEENERLRKSIDRLNDSMNKKSGIAAIKDYEQLKSRQEKVNQNLIAEINNQMGYHSAHHSNNYYASDDIGKWWNTRLNQLFSEHRNDYGKDSVGSVNLNMWHDIYSLSPEQLAVIRDYASDIWEYLTTVGKYDKSEYWENAADAAGKVQEITHSLYQNLTQMSFDTLKDNFLSSLMDMSNDWDDTLDGMMDNFEEMFRKAALNFALSSVNQELQTFWEDWGERMKAGTELTEDDIAEYKRRYQELVEKGLAERERIADITGYDETNAKRQEADKKGFAGMSQDLGEELNGRFTAVQIAGENVSAQMNVAVPILTGIGVSASRTADMVDGLGRVADDMLTHIVESYTELNLIRVNTDDLVKIGKENQQTLKKMASDLKRI